MPCALHMSAFDPKRTLHTARAATMPGMHPWGNETARVHQHTRRCGCMAVCNICPAAIRTRRANRLPNTQDRRFCLNSDKCIPTGAPTISDGSKERTSALSTETQMAKWTVCVHSLPSLSLSMWMSSSQWTRRPLKPLNKQRVRSQLLLRSQLIRWELDWSRSLGHPGGNATGLSLLAPETDQKTLEVLKETLPKTKRVAMIVDPKNQGMMLRLNAIQIAVSKLAIELQSIPALNSSELAAALTAVAKNRPDALFVLSPIYAAYQNEIGEFATKTKVPLLVDTSGLAGEPGALLSYGADISALFRRAATFVDKILKGAKPADLPVEQPAKFELVINLKTAKALGLDVPPTVLLRADKVIE